MAQCKCVTVKRPYHPRSPGYKRKLCWGPSRGRKHGGITSNRACR